MIYTFLEALSWSLSFIFTHQPIFQKPAQDTGMEIAADGDTFRDTQHGERSLGRTCPRIFPPGQTGLAHLHVSGCSEQPVRCRTQSSICPITTALCISRGVSATGNPAWRSLREVGKGRKCVATGEQLMQTKSPAQSTQNQTKSSFPCSQRSSASSLTLRHASIGFSFYSCTITNKQHNLFCNRDALAPHSSACWIRRKWQVLLPVLPIERDSS